MTESEIKDMLAKLAKHEADGAQDNLHRARAGFRGLTPEQMNEPYGQGDMTPSQILAAYEAQKTRAQAALEWISK